MRQEHYKTRRPDLSTPTGSAPAAHWPVATDGALFPGAHIALQAEDDWIPEQDRLGQPLLYCEFYFDAPRGEIPDSVNRRADALSKANIKVGLHPNRKQASVRQRSISPNCLPKAPPSATRPLMLRAGRLPPSTRSSGRSPHLTRSASLRCAKSGRPRRRSRPRVPGRQTSRALTGRHATNAIARDMRGFRAEGVSTRQRRDARRVGRAGVTSLIIHRGSSCEAVQPPMCRWGHLVALPTFFDSSLVAG